MAILLMLAIDKKNNMLQKLLDFAISFNKELDYEKI